MSGMNVKSKLILAIFGLLVAIVAVPPPARAAGPQVPPEALRCLALAVYFEARGESIEGKAAVAHVVVNRAREAGFPDRVCDVVQQGGEQRPCQFAWYCDGRSDQPRAGRMWETSLDVAQEVVRHRGLALDALATGLEIHGQRQATQCLGRHLRTCLVL